MGSELLPKQRAEASRRGWMAVGGFGLTTAFLFNSMWFMGFLALAGAVWLTRRWFQYRAQWGMRF